MGRIEGTNGRGEPASARHVQVQRVFFVNHFGAVRDDATHVQLRNDSLEHLWQRHREMYATHD